MNNTHTPGPWIAQGLSIFDGQNSTPLAQVYERFYRRGDERPACERAGAEANARLIAAAPDLLDACRIAETAIDLHDCLSPEKRETLEIEAVQAIRQAIAKTTGNDIPQPAISENLNEEFTAADVTPKLSDYIHFY